MTRQDVTMLHNLYRGRALYQGELHDHANTGGTSDGEKTLEHWKGAMEALQMDFATILDHKQVRHMYLPEWDDTIFIGGTEPAAPIKLEEGGEYIGGLHYNMIFSDPKQLEGLLEEFPEYEFTGGPEGHFRYRSFTIERFGKLIDAVKRRGGFFVLPHPMQVTYGTNNLDWAFRDEVGIEVTYIALDSGQTKRNYEVWMDLLKRGKRMWVCAGGDRHACAHDWALTSIYAEKKHSECYISHLRQGDFTAGSVGIQMCVGDTPMGGKCNFDGQRLVIRVGRFHKSVRNPYFKYRLDVWNEEKIVHSQEISCEVPTYVAMDAEDCKFYRVEIYDTTRNLRIALGNPIWNEE